LWCLTRHLKPEVAVEARVGQDLAARLILEALDANLAGRLISVDQGEGQSEGHALEPRLSARHATAAGPIQRSLMQIQAEFGAIDLCVYDGAQGGRSIRFELETAWSALRPGGALVVDNIGASPALNMLMECHGDHRAIVCASQPSLPGIRRFEPEAKFAMLLKQP
jgi:predicted O-methyltransferase YrrM